MHISEEVTFDLRAEFELCKAMDGIFISQNSYIDVLTILPQDVTVFGDRAFQEVIKVLRSLEQALIQHNRCPSKKRNDGPRHRERRPRGDRERKRQSSTSQRERLQKKPTL